MIGETRGSRMRVVLLAAIVSAVVVACDREDRDDEQSRSLVLGGVPGPVVALHAGSPVTDYLRYGDALTFAVDSPGSVRFTKLVNDTTSVLRVRSAMGLPRTDDTAYITGRIIARWETYRGRSPFGAPIGVAYLFVKRTAPGLYSGTLFAMSYLTGDTSRITVFQRHTPYPGPSPQPMSFSEECDVEGSAVGDTIVACCACGQARNCSSNLAFPES